MGQLVPLHNGVYLDKTVVNKWKSSIRLNQREVHLGYYANETAGLGPLFTTFFCVKTPTPNDDSQYSPRNHSDTPRE
jgi:hypothetical protein